MSEKYYINNDGSYYGASNRTIALKEVPFAPERGNQIWNGEAWEDGEDPRSYRDKRREAYKLLGKEPGFEDAVGDILDALFKYIMTQNPDALKDPDLGPILQGIAAIKLKYPKGVEDNATTSGEKEITEAPQ